MKDLNKDYFNRPFSHIYVEKSVRDHSRTKEVLAKFPFANVIELDHYKEVFCRRGQSYTLQHETQNLILAAKDGTMIYKGSPVCQSFGNENFYYTSCMMNCIYDCEYCYLKGMYPSANLVIFVNIEDIFYELERILESQSLYLCVSFDTDLFAMEEIIGYVGAWSQFAAGHKECLKIEIRTKCARKSLFKDLTCSPNVIYAFTLSPQVIIERYEYYTAGLAERIDCVVNAMQAGFLVRLCFDPMIYIYEWQRYYREMLIEVYKSIDMRKLVDVSVGTFRISQDYLKKMRKQEPNSAIAWFPYQKDDGFYHYPKELMEQMERYFVELLKEKVPEEKIFLWKE